MKVEWSSHALACLLYYAGPLMKVPVLNNCWQYVGGSHLILSQGDRSKRNMFQLAGVHMAMHKALPCSHLKGHRKFYKQAVVRHTFPVVYIDGDECGRKFNEVKARRAKEKTTRLCCVLQLEKGVKGVCFSLGCTHGNETSSTMFSPASCVRCTAHPSLLSAPS